MSSVTRLHEYIESSWLRSSRLASLLLCLHKESSILQATLYVEYTYVNKNVVNMHTLFFSALNDNSSLA